MRSRARVLTLVAAALFAGLALAQGSHAEAEAKAVVGFTASETPGEYTFDTGVVRGAFRSEGKSIGLLPVEHVTSGAPLTKWPGLLTYYRVFTTNHRYGDSMRGIPSEVQELSGGALQVRWPAADGRPFELTAMYRWKDASTLDLETTVKAVVELPDFEVFLSSYCSDLLPATAVYVKELGETGKPGFMVAKEDYGTWQVYARDEQAVDIVKDGRWTIPPSPVDWAVMPEIAGPLVFRRVPETGVAVILMAPPEDAFAVFTPCRDEAHRSMYLSFFGRTLEAGETAQAHARLVLGHPFEECTIVGLYEAYLQEMRKEGDR